MSGCVGIFIEDDEVKTPPMKNEGIPVGIVFEGAAELDNPYSVIATNPARFPEANYMDAMLMIAWLTGPEGQAKTHGFKVDGQALFHPAAVPAAGE